jgi:hypothetical protein
VKAVRLKIYVGTYSSCSKASEAKTFYFSYNLESRVVSGTEQNNRNSPFLTWISQKSTKGLTALTSVMDCDRTAMGLPPATSAVFLIAKLFWLNMGVSEVYCKSLCQPFRGKAWVVCLHLILMQLLWAISTCEDFCGLLLKFNLVGITRYDTLADNVIFTFVYVEA